jgi:Sin3 histone deacetylase corepressor complex component SDS3
MNDTDLNRYSPHSHLNDSDDSNDLSEAEDYDSDLSGDGNAPHRPRGEFTEMKEQMYQDKLADLKHQLTKLNNGTLTEWQKKLNKLEKVYKERIRYTEVVRDLEVEMVSS